MKRDLFDELVAGKPVVDRSKEDPRILQAELDKKARLHKATTQRFREIRETSQALRSAQVFGVMDASPGSWVPFSVILKTVNGKGFFSKSFEKNFDALCDELDRLVADGILDRSDGYFTHDRSYRMSEGE